MADAKKCDICGKFYAIPICNDNGDIINLCDDCYKKICDFVK